MLLAKIERGIQQADAGQLIPHKKVKERVIGDSSRMSISRTSKWMAMVGFSLSLIFLPCCRTGDVPERDSGAVAPMWDEVPAFLAGYFLFFETQGVWPADLDELVRFCRDNALKCHNLDWSRFSLRRADGDKTVIEYHGPDGSISTVVNPAPGDVEGSESLMEGLREKLNENVRAGKESMLKNQQEN